jgi:tRNA-dihydrouridine synthase 1
VLANGNIRHLQDALDCMAYTGADGVLSAESLLEDAALFSPCRSMPGVSERRGVILG